MPQPMCRHCEAKKANRPRGLCWGCYGTPGVKDMYPPKGTNVPPAERKLKTPPPTTATAGSEEKLTALVKRAENGQHLWNENDGPHHPEGR